MAEVYNPTASIEHESKPLTDSANVLHNILREGVKEHRKVHYETAISACGFLAGVTVLRQSRVDMAGKKPGMPIEGDGIDSAAVRLIDFMRGLCAEASLGREGGWMDSIPKEHRPNKKMGELITEFEPQFRGILLEFNVEPHLHPGVACSAAVQFLKEGATHLHIDIGKALVTHALVKAAKTVPPPLMPPVKPKLGKPWWKVW